MGLSIGRNNGSFPGVFGDEDAGYRQTVVRSGKVDDGDVVGGKVGRCDACLRTRPDHGQENSVTTKCSAGDSCVGCWASCCNILMVGREFFVGCGKRGDACCNIERGEPNKEADWLGHEVASFIWRSSRLRSESSSRRRAASSN